jgi:hypothetical protein
MTNAADIDMPEVTADATATTSISAIFVSMYYALGVPSNQCSYIMLCSLSLVIARQ